MLNLTSKKLPEPTWVSFLEVVGEGDGERKEFRVPFPATARGVEVSFDLYVVDREKWKLTPAAEGDADQRASLTFEEAPARGVRVEASAFDREDAETAFLLLPSTRGVTDLVTEKIGKALAEKTRLTEPEEFARKMTREEQRNLYSTTVDVLVVDWRGIALEGVATPCNAEMKRKFVDQLDPLFFMPWVSRRSRALAVDRLRAREAAEKN